MIYELELQQEINNHRNIKMDKTRTSLSFTAFGITYNYLIIRNLKLLLVTKVKTILKILKNIPPTSLKKFNQIYLELLRINATLKHF